jgi:putative oxidoreductase
MAIQDMIFGSNIDAIAVSIAMLILRVFVGALFIVHGAPKLYGPARKQMRDSMKQLGIPGPLFDLVGVLEFLGGIALIIGFLTRIASSLLALEMVGTTILYITKLYYAPIPRGYTESMFKATRGYMFGWELDSVLLASGLAIAIIGPGTISIDNLVLTKLR